MPYPFRAGPALRRPAVLASALLLCLAGCGGDEARDPPPRRGAPIDPLLQCLPTARLPLTLPLEAALAFELPEPASAEAAGCVRSLFGDSVLNTPAALDPGYDRVFAHHEEDARLVLAALPREDLQLHRVGATAGADAWLLRIDAGDVPGTRRDLLFTTARADGALVDQMLVGALGLFHRRDYDLASADSFGIRERTGTPSDPGPGYRAHYRITDAGRFERVSSRIVPVAQASGPD